MRALLLVVLFTGCGAPPIKVLPPAPEHTENEFFKGLINSTVQVWVTCPDGTSGSGSGVVVKSTDSATYIATAAHVAKGFICTLKIDGRAYEVMDLNRDQDVAILKGPSSGRQERSMALPHLGQLVIAVGYPWQLHDSKTGLQVTWGNLSAYVKDRYKFTAPIFFGNSGGPLFNDQGQVLGLVVSCMTSDNSIPIPGEYFATPSMNVFKMLESVLEDEQKTN